MRLIFPTIKSVNTRWCLKIPQYTIGIRVACLYRLEMIIQQILSYVNEHPDAKDAFEGIQKYWLAGCPSSNSEELQNILDLLVSREWLLISDGGFSPTLYWLNKDMTGEVQLFLDRLAGRDREANA